MLDVKSESVVQMAVAVDIHSLSVGLVGHKVYGGS